MCPPAPSGERLSWLINDLGGLLRIAWSSGHGIGSAEMWRPRLREVSRDHLNGLCRERLVDETQPLVVGDVERGE